MCQGGFVQADDRYRYAWHAWNKNSGRALKHYDLFLAVGTRFSDTMFCNANLFARHCPIIQIDIDRQI